MQRTRATARGTVWTSLAQAVAGISGFCLVVYLARVLGPSEFGLWVVVLSVINWFEFTSISLWSGAVSKFVSAHGSRWREVADSALLGSLGHHLLWMAVLLAAAPSLGRLFGNPEIVRYLRLFALDLPLFGLLFLLAAVMAGKGSYGHRAIGMMLYWVAKLLFMGGFVALGFGITGAIVGSIAASVVGLVWVAIYAGARPRRTVFPIWSLLTFALPIMVSAVLFKLLQSVDLWMVKGLLKDSALAGQYGVGAGVMQAALFVCYALNTTLLPSASRELTEGRIDAVRNTVKQAYRFILMVLGLPAAVMAAAATPIVQLVFSDKYTDAGAITSVMAVAALMLSVVTIGSSLLTAAGKPGRALVVMLLLVPIQVVLCWILIPRYELVGAALATTAAGLAGAAIMSTLVWREFGVLVQPLVPLRIALAGLIAWLVGVHLALTGPMVLLECLAMTVIYLAMLFATRELRRADLEPFLLFRKTSSSNMGS